jgi:threonine dehydratase
MPVTEQAVAVTLEDVVAAAERIKGLAKKTPVMTSRLFDEASGMNVFFKCENLQSGGAFKIRGAANFLMSLSEAERKRGVVTYSSGNHAQAVAMAAAHLGMKAIIVMPMDAPKSKIESTRRFEPEIIFFDRFTQNREEIAGQIAFETGMVVVPSYDHAWIVAGQGTAALELMQEQPDLDAILVCLGGGGFLSGSAIVARALRPETKVFGVEPELGNDWHLSLKAGKRVAIAPPATIADGLRTIVPGELTFPIVQALSAGVILVSEDEIRYTVRFMLSRMKMLTEPSGAVGAAAALHRRVPAGIQKLGVMISGGNVDMDVLGEICAQA